MSYQGGSRLDLFFRRETHPYLCDPFEVTVGIHLDGYQLREFWLGQCQSAGEQCLKAGLARQRRQRLAESFADTKS